MKIYLIYDKTLSQFIDKRNGDGRKYLVYGDVRSARAMANNIKKYGIGFAPIKYKNDDIVVVGYEANIEHMLVV